MASIEVPVNKGFSAIKILALEIKKRLIVVSNIMHFFLDSIFSGPEIPLFKPNLHTYISTGCLAFDKKRIQNAGNSCANSEGIAQFSRENIG